jgi:hypothetical protein
MKNKILQQAIRRALRTPTQNGRPMTAFDQVREMRRQSDANVAFCRTRFALLTGGRAA